MATTVPFSNPTNPPGQFTRFSLGERTTSDMNKDENEGPSITMRDWEGKVEWQAP